MKVIKACPLFSASTTKHEEFLPAQAYKEKQNTLSNACCFEISAATG